MSDIKMGFVESKFAEIIWENEPLNSGKLVEICKENLNWKKSTTYTVLRRLCERGIFKNENGIVTSIVSRNEFYALQSEYVVNETFSGSLPAFIAAFTTKNDLSSKDIKEIRKIIDSLGSDANK